MNADFGFRVLGLGVGFKALGFTGIEFRYQGLGFKVCTPFKEVHIRVP